MDDYNEYEKFVLSRHKDEISKYKYQIESNINTSVNLLIELGKKYNITVNMYIIKSIYITYEYYLKYKKHISSTSAIILLYSIIQIVNYLN